MDISKNSALIEAILLEDLPNCDAISDVDISDDENHETVQPPSLRDFDEIFEEALEREVQFNQNLPLEEELQSSNPQQVPDEVASGSSNPVVDDSDISSGIRPSSSSRKRPEVNRRWKKCDRQINLPEYFDDTGAVESYFSGCDTPTDSFLVFIDPILDNIVFQSNLYATTKNKILNLKKEELIAFIGINFYMGYNSRPAWTDHYSSAPDLNNALICKTMTRDRFAAILSSLHCNDNSMMPRNCKDKLFKIRPMLEELNRKFQECYHGTREMSVDESMIKFKGRSVLKQYLPMKPIKRGYKLWCLADQRGFIKKFMIYQGKDEEMSAKFADYSLGERVVLELTENEWRKNKVIYFDNFFSSVPLLEKLLTEGTFGCGTIRSNRKGLPNNMQADNTLKRGDYDYRFSNLNVGFWKWKDNKVVHFVSNFHGNEEATVSRKEKNGTRSAVTCPSVVKDYNQFMGGVDTADRLRALYCVDRKSPKWWHRLFWGMMDIAFVNAYIVHGLLQEKMPVKDFRRSVAQGLMSKKDPPVSKKKRLTRENTPSPSISKRRKTGFSTLKDVRMGNRGIHWPRFDKSRGRCEVCSMKSIQSKPYTKCSHCNVFLCLNEKKNCFSEYHEIEIQ